MGLPRHYANRVWNKPLERYTDFRRSGNEILLKWLHRVLNEELAYKRGVARPNNMW